MFVTVIVNLVVGLLVLLLVYYLRRFQNSLDPKPEPAPEHEDSEEPLPSAFVAVRPFLIRSTLVRPRDRLVRGPDRMWMLNNRSGITESTDITDITDADMLGLIHRFIVVPEGVAGSALRTTGQEPIVRTTGQSIVRTMAVSTTSIEKDVFETAPVVRLLPKDEAPEPLRNSRYERILDEIDLDDDE